MLTSRLLEGESYNSTKMVSIVVLGDEICSARIVRGPSPTIKELSVKEPVVMYLLKAVKTRESKEQTPYSCVYAVICKVAHAQ